MKYKNPIYKSTLPSNMKEHEAEYAKVTIIISSPDSNVPSKIQQSKIEYGTKVERKAAKLKAKLEIKKQSDDIEEDRARRHRQDNVGLCVIIIFMVSSI